MKKYLKYLFLLLPLAGFITATISVIILNVIPNKFLALVIAAEFLVFVFLAVLLSRRHKAPIIISVILCVITAIAASVASYFLITANSAINHFAAQNVVVTAETGTADITKDSFILLVSGIDSKTNDATANTDVNQMIVVNPRTHNILIVNTPRDYYVYLHGITEMPDKLTHAGYYGTEMSRQTLEDLYNINIDYYVRINFETLTNLVDLIGGVDIYSDWSFTTSGHTYVQQGWNHMDGKEALAFARERKFFGNGDIQRGNDQQTVMIAIFNKLTHSTELLTNFSSLLNSLSGSFTTDLNIGQVKELVKLQLEQNSEWHIETTAVTGESAYTTEVYSLDRVNSYFVMIPDQDSINAARDRILEVLDQ